MSERILSEISSKIDKLIRLQALDYVREVQSEQDKIKLLDSMGFKATEISSILDKTPQNVYVVLSQLRKKSRQSDNAKSKEKTQSPNQSQLDQGTSS